MQNLEIGKDINILVCNNLLLLSLHYFILLILLRKNKMKRMEARSTCDRPVAENCFSMLAVDLKFLVSQKLFVFC